MRGDGKTTKQMLDAPKNALFIWCDVNLDYPKYLAIEIGREDLQIESPYFICSDRWRGREFTAVILDHALTLSISQFNRLAHVQSRVRP